MAAVNRHDHFRLYFNTSEFMPIGLLTDIAADFRMTEAQAGMLITIYAYVVMLMSLPLMIAASRYPLRKLLLATISLFAVSHVASAFATGFWTLLLSRIGVAFASPFSGLSPRLSPCVWSKVPLKHWL